MYSDRPYFSFKLLERFRHLLVNNTFKNREQFWPSTSGGIVLYGNCISASEVFVERRIVQPSLLYCGG